MDVREEGQNPWLLDMEGEGGFTDKELERWHEGNFQFVEPKCQREFEEFVHESFRIDRTYESYCEHLKYPEVFIMFGFWKQGR